MYNFLLYMWKAHRLTAEQVDAAATLGRITEEQRDAIKATER